MGYGSDRKRIEFRWIEPEKLVPNQWNPNRLSDELTQKLLNDIREKGFILPIVARPIDKEKYQIVDGEHRWRIAKNIGLKSIPCIIAEMDEQEAKIKTIQLNRLRGEDEPELLAKLLEELSAEIDIEELSGRLPFDPFEIKESLELLEIKESRHFKERLQKEYKELAKKRIFSVVVSEEEKRLLELAIFQHQKSRAEEISAGKALAEICEIYLRKSKTEQV